MKKIINIFCITSALLASLAGGLWGCAQKEEPQQEVVDLRYRVEDSYELSATNAQAFTILVASTHPWMVTSEHPDWCIIDIEEGDASDAKEVRTGKATPTTVKVKYYDNTDLDDRTDRITISSDYWVGKVVTVNQKGIAYLSVPEEDLSMDVLKAGGDFTVHIKSNQDWSAKVTEGDWLSIKGESTGNGAGTVTVTAAANAQELRYGEMAVYDRHNVESAKILFTQDGVQLVPVSTEIRALYDQAAAEVEVKSNTKWTVAKEAETDDWFQILTTSGEGDGKIQLTFVQNDGEGMRRAGIIIKNVVDNPEEFQVEKSIMVKQGYHVVPVVHVFDNEELATWNAENPAVLPTFVSGNGMFFPNGCTLQNGSMPFGDYTFYWKDINAVNNGVRIRTVFAYTDIEEIKFGVRINSSGKNVMYLDFNAASSGKSGKPEGYSVPEDLDFTVPHTFGCRFLPIMGSEYCHVSIYLDGKMILEFDTSEKIMDEVKWGTKINMYISVDSGAAGDSAVLEKYEYSAPLNWDE